ncbi:MAG TPA: cyclic nucleotide-binding domain-containing protein [Gaiellaceae bacterium]|nr:cyclic nucleotide-binding domain-containing protein [Gaiellaceae bacterium]
MALGLRRDAKAKLISGVPLFAGLSKRELAQVSAIADELDFGSGKTLIREGDAGREFFILLEGSADVTLKGKVLATHGPGAFFGEVALMCDTPRIATVKTTSPSRALVITDRDFRTLVKTSPGIALKVLEAVGRRLPSDDA